MVDSSPTGIVILAAGASTRMGEPKQLLRFGGMSLLNRAIQNALASPCRPVIVVVGAGAVSLQAEIVDPRAHVVVNQAWATGMGASIRLGVMRLEQLTAGQAQAVVILLCDQPFVTSAVIDRLLETFATRRPLLVASAHESAGEIIHGVPALFSRALFQELLELRSAGGAKELIYRHAREAVVIPVPEAACDIDTPHDYRLLQAIAP